MLHILKVENGWIVTLEDETNDSDAYVFEHLNDVLEFVSDWIRNSDIEELH